MDVERGTAKMKRKKPVKAPLIRRGETGRRLNILEVMRNNLESIKVHCDYVIMECEFLHKAIEDEWYDNNSKS